MLGFTAGCWAGRGAAATAAGGAKVAAAARNSGRVALRAGQEQVQVTREVVQRTARLAQLHLTDDELTELTPEFAKMIGFVEQMNEVDLTGLEPMTRVEDVFNVLRPDRVAGFTDQQAILDQAPLVEGDFIRVPKITTEGE